MSLWKLTSSLTRREFIRRFAAFTAAGAYCTGGREGFTEEAKSPRKPSAAPRPSLPPSPPTRPSGAAAWVVRKLPESTGSPRSIIHAPLSHFTYAGVASGLSGGAAKHSTVIHCPLNGLLYVFGGDYSGYSTVAEQTANQGSDDFRNDIYTYNAATNTWALVSGYDVLDGHVHPWRPDWGKYAWDTKRNVFWFHRGGSSGAVLGAGAFPNDGSTGLVWRHGAGRIMPDTTQIPAGSLTLPNDSTTYVEYNPTSHAVTQNGAGWTGGKVLTLFLIKTAVGAVSSVVDKRPDYIDWGYPTTDNPDPRHYGAAMSLLTFDPTTREWADPGMPTIESQIPARNRIAPNGHTYNLDWSTMCMVYDAGADQLVTLGDSYSIHFNIKTQSWAHHPLMGPTLNGHIARFWFCEADRLIYFISTIGQSGNPYDEAHACAYDVDAHIWWIVAKWPNHQQGLGLWPDHRYGLPCGAGFEGGHVWHDSTNDILWWAETTNPYLNKYGYGGDGTIVAMHAWHYMENRFERVTPAYDASNQPHVTVNGFDPVNNLFLGWGQNAPSTDPKSVYHPADDPVIYKPYLYAWTPSGFTKPAWSTMP